MIARMALAWMLGGRKAARIYALWTGVRWSQKKVHHRLDEDNRKFVDVDRLGDWGNR